MRKLLLGAVAGGILLAALAVALLMRPAASRPPIRIGLNPWPGYEPLHLAQKLGYFREESVEVELVGFTDLLDTRRAYERGQIDGLGTTAVEVVLTRGQSARPLRIVQVVDWSDGGDLLIADTSIKDLGQLRGRRVGVEVGSVSLYLLARAMSLNGIALEELRLEGANPGNFVPHLASGELAAMVTYPPHSVAALRSGRCRVLFDSRSLPGEIVDVLSFDSLLISERPEDVRRILRAFWKARAFARAHPEVAQAWMAEREGVTLEEFRSSLEGIRLVGPQEQAGFLEPTGSLLRVLVRIDSLLRSKGQIARPVDPRALVSQEFLEQGIPR